jgi:endonuclease YncB( thermonuclease family)
LRKRKIWTKGLVSCLVLLFVWLGESPSAWVGQGYQEMTNLLEARGEEEILKLLLMVPVPRVRECHTVKRIEGNLLLLDNNEQVRLIGVAPEELTASALSGGGKEKQGSGSWAMGWVKREITAFRESLLLGKRICLQYELAGSSVGPRELNGRVLAYAYLEDGTFVNAELIKDGYGTVDAQHPFEYLTVFQSLEREAKDENKGLWAQCVN